MRFGQESESRWDHVQFDLVFLHKLEDQHPTYIHKMICYRFVDFAIADLQSCVQMIVI